MKFSWRKLLAFICAALGIMSWFYLGAYRLWKGPIRKLIKAHLAGKVTLTFALKILLEIFGWLTFAGFTWCLWNILRDYFKGRK